MMKRSLSVNSPVVVTLLSPSPAASRRVQQCLTKWLGLRAVDDDFGSMAKLENGDALDGVFGKTLVTSPIGWDSVSLASPTPPPRPSPSQHGRTSTSTNTNNQSTTRTLLHLLSPKTDADLQGPLSLLAVQQVDSIPDCRLQLAEKLPQTASATMLTLQHHMLGRAVTAPHLLGRHGLPLLQWSKISVSSTSSNNNADPGKRIEAAQQPSFAPGELKEIAIPAPDNARYNDERNEEQQQTLFSKLSQSTLDRPVTGLYRFPGTDVCMRPLPAAQEDRQVPPPSLIFHVDDLDHLETALENILLDENKRQWESDTEKNAGNMVLAERIGYSGIQKGQIRICHPFLAGLDLRLCASTKWSSMFAEAQESLLAGSLSELQSTHVLDDGGRRQGVSKKLDPRTNNMDCWVEFRANMSNPTGFLAKSPSSKLRIAKAPDLPYE